MPGANSLLWTRADVDRGLAVIRKLQAAHPEGLILDAATARLYAFRHERASRHAAADALRKYADEITPRRNARQKRNPKLTRNSRGNG